jgi:hypothetical protein
MAILEYLFTIVLISGVMWALHESNINRDFGLKKAILLYRHTFSNQNFITLEFQLTTDH